MPVILRIGAYSLDVLEPDPLKIDLAQIERNLWSAHRFSNNPQSLVVRQHTKLVSKLAVKMKEPVDVVDWCKHHDDHEGIIGDIPGPLKHWINAQLFEGTGPTLDDVEERLDRAICTARGTAYPDQELRQRVHFYDKLAETLEWLFVLGEQRAAWNMAFENWISEAEARRLIVDCASLLPPPELFV